MVLRPGSGEETVQALGRGALDLGLVMDVETRHASVEASCCAPSPWPPSSARTTCWPHAGW
ncbi:hypothetical protein [Streptomyces sp. NBC_00829]|uniref:hypothetical protein n=1 Tax=Streptomyces sp. NBC_00829 TaxID=2903679 RepID=UPI00386E34F8|nr:hypothetical protein OG293_37985 [Streptomyces sp. NBC_00829]